MNDRFATQLRQHLRETSDVGPADGQLARVLGGVAATTQRHPVTARLLWNPGRIGPIPSAAIRYGLIAAALALATLAGAGLAGGLARPSSVFEGTWITIDPADGSGMTLVVGPGETPDVYFEDGYATGLACVDDHVKRFTARGTGEISGNSLVATFPDGGGCGLDTVDVPGAYDYEQDGDTLTGQDGIVWTRALGEQPETQAPETLAPIPTEASSPTPPSPSSAPDSTSPPDEAVAITPEPDPECIQFDAPGTYTGPVGSISLTVAMPGSAAEPWHGHRDSFDVMRSACADLRGGSGWIHAGGVTLVDTTACDGPEIGVANTADAIAAVSAAKGIDVVERADVTIDGYAGARFDIRVQDDPNPCPDSQIPLLDGLDPVDLGMSVRLYLIDVDGTTLALGLFGYDDWIPPVRGDVDGIIASMQIAPVR